MAALALEVRESVFVLQGSLEAEGLSTTHYYPKLRANEDGEHDESAHEFACK